ncbi:MarR family transcriptional regulator [Actinocorallia lasiicapitis]
MEDAVDRMMEQWRAARPELDPSPMGVFGRISRLNRLLEKHINGYFGRYDLEFWEFDMLATLRRAGDDGELTAGALLKASMVTSGAITNRIDRLERKGLVERRQDPADRRSVRVRLTGPGAELIDTIIAGHFDNERRALEPLDDPDVLAGELRKLLLSLGDTTLG